MYEVRAKQRGGRWYTVSSHETRADAETAMSGVVADMRGIRYYDVETAIGLTVYAAPMGVDPNSDPECRYVGR